MFKPHDLCGRQHPRLSFKTSQACGEYKEYAIVCEEKASHDSVKKPADRSILVLNDDANADKRMYADILVNGFFVKFTLDSGSTVNTIPKSIYDSFPQKPALQPAKDNIQMSNNLQLTTAGTVNVILTHPRTGKQLSTEVYITEQEQPVLSISACRALNLIEINYANICDDSDDSIQTRQEIIIHSDVSIQKNLQAHDVEISEDFYEINDDFTIEIDDDFLIEIDDEAEDESYESMIEIDESEVDDSACDSFDGIFELFDDFIIEIDDDADEKADDDDDEDESVGCTANAEKLCDLFKENLDSLESEYMCEDCTANSENFCKGILSSFENDEDDDEDFTEMPSTLKIDLHSSTDESASLRCSSEDFINIEMPLHPFEPDLDRHTPDMSKVESPPSLIVATGLRYDAKNLMTATDVEPTAEGMNDVRLKGRIQKEFTDVFNASRNFIFESGQDNSMPVRVENPNLLHPIHLDTNECPKQNALHRSQITSDRRREEESHICEALKVHHPRPPAFKLRSGVKFKQKPTQKDAEKDKHRFNRREALRRGQGEAERSTDAQPSVHPPSSIHPSQPQSDLQTTTGARHRDAEKDRETGANQIPLFNRDRSIQPLSTHDASNA